MLSQNVVITELQNLNINYALCSDDISSSYLRVSAVAMPLRFVMC